MLRTPAFFRIQRECRAFLRCADRVSPTLPCPFRAAFRAESTGSRKPQSKPAKLSRRHSLRHVFCPRHAVSSLFRGSCTQENGRPAYRPIADYGVIGNCETCALVSGEGSVDWLCVPSFDGAAVFAGLLDGRKGGHFALRPVQGFRSEVQYATHSTVLITTFRTMHGDVKVTDFMPLGEGDGAARFARPRAQRRLVRLVEGLTGRVEMRVEWRPRPAFGTTATRIREEGECLSVNAECVPAFRLLASMRLDAQGDQVEATFTINAGAREVFVLDWYDEALPSRGLAEWSTRALEQTLAFWRRWHEACPYRGPYYESVMRSLATLKLLTFAPSGAMVAAPTTSLPEELGGIRNWDYRYCWIRDASLAFHALLHAGHSEDTRCFMQWVCEIALRCEPGGLQIMYGLRGERDLAERSLDHLEGYCRSRPVRIGNHASTQFQLDVYGELLECFEILRCSGQMPVLDVSEMWPAFSAQVDVVARRWREPDSGIWEMRSPPQHFVLSKVFAWVALDRGISAAESAGLPADLDRWRCERAAVRDDVLRKGYDASIGAFVQAYGSAALDAANLLLPIVGFIDVTDPRMRSTVEAVEAKLMSNGLVYRYRGSDDGLPGGEATFGVCTFWLVENLAALGRIQEAKALFEAMLARGTPLGLFAEELVPEGGAHLGNFPQALTHIGLINAAVALARHPSR